MYPVSAFLKFVERKTNFFFDCVDFQTEEGNDLRRADGFLLRQGDVDNLAQGLEGEKIFLAAGFLRIDEEEVVQIVGRVMYASSG